MATITKRGNSYRAEISNYKHGVNNRITKTFKTKAEAKRWAMKQEITKGDGIDLARRQDTFASFFENWVYIVKKNDVRPATFLNYTRTIPIVKNLFKDIKLNELNDLVVQMKIDEYGKTHSRKTTTEVLLKIRSSLRYAYGRGLLATDFAGLVKTRGKELDKRNKALSITEFKKLRSYLIENPDTEFKILCLLALETGARRGELLGIKPDDITDTSIKIKRSISPTSDDTRLKTKSSKREISINADVSEILKTVEPKESGYIFDPDNFHQSQYLAKLLKELDISKTTFHGLRDTHASFLFSHDNIRLDYISQRLGHSSLQTTQNYYLELMPEKKHLQDADALGLLNSLSD
ncbi:site-specific integrase [Lactococcus cremoris]|uniref:tyrosine-type recombinase/integrase n=1 Tax=Lactococcus lactis subsp. cremoris TaxID=1359 RepID=UPI0020BDD08E|nr:site-specific integrase [Lactococcus cremoris]BDE10885.1 site-specific integrase [Lactococcus cremoris]